MREGIGNQRVLLAIARRVLPGTVPGGPAEQLFLSLGSALGVDQALVFLALQRQTLDLLGPAPAGAGELLAELEQALESAPSAARTPLLAQLRALLAPPPAGGAGTGSEAVGADDTVGPVEPPEAGRSSGAIELPRQLAGTGHGLDMPPVTDVTDPAADGEFLSTPLGQECEGASLKKLLQTRNDVSRVINRRFKRKLALAFSDIVGSTSYFQRFGDESGQTLMMRLMDHTRRVLPIGDGRIVETTGDGAFTCYPSVGQAVAANVELQKRIAQENHETAGDHGLRVRVGIHWGSVLADAELVTGDAVNYAARVTTLAGDGEIVISRTAYQELPSHGRTPGRTLAPANLKGIATPVEALLLEWRDPGSFPARVRILETDEEHELPSRETISFGRLAGSEGGNANDIVLSHPDPAMRQKISRWHFTLQRHPDGFRLRSLSERPTELNGCPVAQGAELPLAVGSIVRVSGVLTLVFLAAGGDKDGDDALVQTVI
jgi:class 3 adenylate cyclase